MSETQVHQVEKDPLQNIQGWWQKNQKTVLIAIVAIVVVIGGWFGYKKLVVEPKEEKANLAIYPAQRYYNKDSFALALNGDGPHKGVLYIINNYGGTKAANLAKYYAGTSYLHLGDFNNAIKYLSDFSTDAKQLQMMAYGALGDAYSSVKKNDEAISSYKKAAETFDSDELNASEYLFRAGALSQLIGKKDEAVTIYEQLRDKFPNTLRGRDAEKYINTIRVKKAS